MSNLTTFRNAVYSGTPLPTLGIPLFLKSGENLFGGSLVFVDTSNGYAYASTGATRVCVGFNNGVDLTATSDTSTQVYPQRGALRLANSGTSAIANTDRGKICYAEDNQTARIGSGSYAPLGCVIGIEDSMVVVEVGVGFIATAAGYVTTTTTLTNINALAGTGFLAQTSGGAGSAVFAERTLTAGSASVVISNGTGVSGNPSVDASAGLKDLDGDTATGIVVRTGGTANNGTYDARTITAADAATVVTNPGGVAGNIDLANYHACIEIADPGTGAAIPVVRSSTINMTIGAGAETNTLAAPTFVDQRIVLMASAVAGGTRAVTAASAINAAGNTVMTFNAARDNCELRAVKVGSSLAWEIGFNASVALS